MNVNNEIINRVGHSVFIIGIFYILTDFAKTGQLAGLILLTVMVIGTIVLGLAFGIIGILEYKSNNGMSKYDFYDNVKNIRHMMLVLEYDLKDLNLKHELLKGDNDALKQEVLELKLQVMLDGNWKDTSKNNKTVSHTV